MNLIIFDFETFSLDVLLGAIIINENNEEKLFQSWDREEIKRFYYDHVANSIWIGHNNRDYDNYILQAIINDQNPKKVNDDIIKYKIRYKLTIPLYYYDLMQFHPASLKALEAFVGKNISESEVDFELNRELTEEEKKLTESYNRDDLEQTKEDFYYLYEEFQLRIDMISEFNLSLNDLTATEAQIAAKVLDAHRIDGIEKKVIPAVLYPELKLENEDIKSYFLNEDFKKKDEKGETIRIHTTICGLDHLVGSGGIHGAEKNCTCDWALYLDVSGYYNLIMINYDLLPRSVSKKGKELYEYMYHEQLKLKGVNDAKRAVYKRILLAVFGAMRNQFCDFYDPYKGELVTITGELFIADLLEKLEGKIRLIQSNTDGIMVRPLDGVSEQEVLDIVQEWMDRTHFVIKPKKIYNIVQRDVNNYLYKDEKGNVHVKGEALKHYGGIDNPYKTNGYSSAEPLILHECLTNYLANEIEPEETIKNNRDNLRLFQFICRKVSYDYVQLETYKKKEVATVYKNGKTKIKLEDVMINSQKVQNVNRAFASKIKDPFTILSKYKMDKGKEKKSVIANLPESIFIYNNEILSENSIKKIQEQIDYDYYVYRAYEKILKFINEKGE